MRGSVRAAMAFFLVASVTAAEASPHFRRIGIVPPSEFRPAPTAHGCHGVAVVPEPSATTVEAGRVYALTEAGLTLTDLSGASLEVYPEIRGRALRVEGRRLLVETDGGDVAAYLDVSVGAQLHEVAVQSNAFDPEDLTVAVGDTVRWTNTTGDLHNVFSCTEDQLGCEERGARETFTSGQETGFFVFEHTFAEAGQNPYLCQPHAPFMLGRVTVVGQTGEPPAVPDGMQVTKLASDGGALSLSFDTSCVPVGHQIVHGYAFGLPGATGGGYEPDGGVCAIGATSPYTWNDVPPAFPVATGFVWWLVIATDGAATEGSWGVDGEGQERQGPGVGGSSGTCGIVVKSTANGCSR